MYGNVYQWVEDPFHENYDGAPLDGSVWSEGADVIRRVLRGGFWEVDDLRSAVRGQDYSADLAPI